MSDRDVDLLLDADLLALAGDDGEDSNDDEPQQTQAPVAVSDGEVEGSDDEVAMDESDGEAPDDDASEPEVSEKYPIEGKFTDDAERDHIMSLPEIERETILADRATEIEQEEQSRKLKAIWSSLNKDNDKKRKASDSDLRDGRKSTRQKTVVTTARSENLAELQRKRAEKQNKQSTQSRKERRTESPEADADGESEGEWDDRGRRDQTPEEQPATKRDFDRIRIGRHQFAQVCFFPGFEEAMRGCYVRMSVGPDPRKPGGISYRMAKIEDIIEGAPYAFQNKEGKFQITTQHAVVSIGKKKRETPFIHCSMSTFEQQELDFYLKMLVENNLPAPKKTRLEAKTDDLQALIARRFTSEELTVKLNRSQVLQNNWRAKEETRLAAQIAEAGAVGEDDRVKRIQDQIENLSKNPVKLHYGTSMGSSKAAEANKKSEMTQQQRLAELNRQNRKADAERVRKALLAENRAREKRKATAREMAAKKQDVAAAEETNGTTVHNILNSKDDLELPHAEWSFNYVDFSNNYLGSRAMRHLTYDDKGRAITEWPREMCDDEIIARMDIPITCIVPEYD